MYILSTIQVEVDKLLAVGFIKEVEYPDWLANVVVVPKKWGKWRVCVDYPNLNDVYLKDSFSLPWINQIVDSTVGHGMLSFLDAFFGYHQIPMYQPNEKKNRLHNTTRTLFLQSHVIWAQERRSHLPKADDKDLQTPNRTHCRGVYWWHYGEK